VVQNRTTVPLITYPSSRAVVERRRTEFHVGALPERHAVRVRQAAEHRSFSTVKTNMVVNGRFEGSKAREIPAHRYKVEGSPLKIMTKSKTCFRKLYENNNENPTS